MKSMWLVTIKNRPPFPMVGGQMSYEEALYAARLIWPDAEVS